MSLLGFEGPFAVAYLDRLQNGNSNQDEDLCPSKKRMKKKKEKKKSKQKIKSLNAIVNQKSKNDYYGPGMVNGSYLMIDKVDNSNNTTPSKFQPSFDNSYLKYVLRLAENPYLALIIANDKEVMSLSGLCSLTLIKGTVVVNGYKLLPGVPTEVINPIWIPSATVEFNSNSKHKWTTLEIVNIFHSLHIELSNMIEDFEKLLTTTCCLLLVEGRSKNQQEWLYLAEQQTIYHQNKFDDNPIITISNSNDAKLWFESNITVNINNFVVYLESAVIGDSLYLSQLTEVDVLEIPDNWKLNTAIIISDTLSRSDNKETNNYHVMNNDEYYEFLNHTKVIICGAKGVGKSTLLRYVINSFISLPTIKEIAVIDCDLGQPELTVSGLLSLHIIQSPILSPQHFHITEPILSFFIGDITTKNEPELFSKALNLLVLKYTELRNKRISDNFELYNEKKKLSNKIKGTINMFDVLNDVDEEDDIMNPTDPLPLVVNTDGMIRFMGNEILTIIVDIIKPSHVIQIFT